MSSFTKHDRVNAPKVGSFVAHPDGFICQGRQQSALMNFAPLCFLPKSPVQDQNTIAMHWYTDVMCFRVELGLFTQYPTKLSWNKITSPGKYVYFKNP